MKNQSIQIELQEIITESIKTAFKEQPIKIEYVDSSIDTVYDAMRVITNYCNKKSVCGDCAFYSSANGCLFTNEPVCKWVE